MRAASPRLAGRAARRRAGHDARGSMTALAGLWHFDGQPDAADGCARMLAAQKFYGPHAGAQWSDGDVALGRQLMRVLPEDAFDRQPLVGGGGRYILVADIRLDNR